MPGMDEVNQFTYFKKTYIQFCFKKPASSWNRSFISIRLAFTSSKKYGA